MWRLHFFSHCGFYCHTQGLGQLERTAWERLEKGPSDIVSGASARSAHEANLLRNRLIKAMFHVDPNGPTQWIRKWRSTSDQM
ncbi:unnamed protein product, partial [Mesorhabditis belari]|uniref:Uncharacterized protein n=1 Tax=Mesorhabditis belari TaxID=2138241 RepID=A0AAF3FNP7_9BILA